MADHSAGVSNNGISTQPLGLGLRVVWGTEHEPQRRAATDAQLVGELEAEALIERGVALTRCLEISGQALAVAAIERGAQQRAAKTLSLHVRKDADVTNVVMRLAHVAPLHRGSQPRRPGQ